MYCSSKAFHQQINGLCQSTESVADTVNLGLLKAINDTVDSLAQDRKTVIGLTNAIIGLTQSIDGCSGVALDPEGAICDELDVSEGALNSVISQLGRKRLSALRAPELKNHHEHAVVDAYDQSVQAFIELHDAIVDLRWAVMEHDADLEQPTGEPVNNVTDLVARLQA